MFGIETFKNKVNIPLLIAILIAALLRLSFLSTIPNGFQHDEAAAGYDAYSMLTTLHTQYGQFLPLFSKTFSGSINDYDESIYRFLIIPFILIFGLNEFATRLPAALVGILNILTLYYFVKECFNQRVAIVAAFFLAICPWHIFVSRIAFRAILFPCFFCLALFLFFRALKNYKYLPLSGLAFGICLYTYTSSRVFIPLFLGGLVWCFREYLWKHKAQTLIACTLFALIFFVLFSFWASPELMQRANKSVCFNCLINEPHKYIVYYLSYFNPAFLFLGHPSSRNTAGNIGGLLLIDLITIGAGLFYIIREKRKEYYFLLLWLFLYPIPAALTEGAHDLRSIIGVPLFSTLSAYGLIKIADLFKGDTQKYFYSATAFLLTVSFVVFFKSYFIDFSKRPPSSFQYGMREAITYADKSLYTCVEVSDRFQRPNTMIIFYTQYPPDRYQLSPIEPYTTTNFVIGKYYVTSISKSQVFNEKCLFIIKPQETQEIAAQGYSLLDIHVIKNPRGEEAIKLVEVKKK